MRVEVTDAVPEADVLAFPVGPKGLPALAGDQDAERVAEEEDVGSAVGRTAVLYPNGNAAARRIVLVGLGPAEELDADTLRTAAASVAEAAERVGGTLAWVLDDSLPHSEQARAVVDGLMLGSYDPGRWKTGAKSDHPFERLVLVGGTDELETRQNAPPRLRMRRTARATSRTRAPTSSRPSGWPSARAELADEHEHLTAEALGPDEITELGMGAFAGVAQGSHNPARMIVMRYEPPSPKGDVVLGLVGKAITFDTGGISIKPALYMEDMKGDMSGGAQWSKASASSRSSAFRSGPWPSSPRRRTRSAAARSGPATS